MESLRKKPKKRIVSLRVDTEEMEALLELARISGCSISALLRDSLSLLAHESPVRARAARAAAPLNHFNKRRTS